MGLFKKKDGGDAGADDDRSRLFGSRKGKATPPAQNPYAATPAQDPYANQPPPAYNGNGDSFRQEKSPAVTSQGQRYGGGGSYGQQGGYGSDRFGGGGQQPPVRQGGYGGLGPADDSDRNALFGAAPTRQQQRQQGPPSGSNSYGGYGQSGAYGESGAYGSGPKYDDRELTAEEQEEEDVKAMRNETRFIKEESLSSLDRSEMLLQQALESGRSTMGRLTTQGESLAHTERILNQASSQARIGAEKTAQLKRENRSMFAPTMGNPFTAKSRKEAQERKILENLEEERAQREINRKAQFETNARYDEVNRNMRGPGGNAFKPSTTFEKAKNGYLIESDDEDEDRENRIEEKLQRLHMGVKGARSLATAIGEEVDHQNTLIDRSGLTANGVENSLSVSRDKLSRIH